MTRPAAPSTSANLVRTFLAWAASEPDRPYFQVNRRSVTYGEARATFTTVANVIRSRGWGSEGPIGLSTNDPADLLTAIWACLHAGVSVAFCPRCEDVGQMQRAVSASGAEILLTDLEHLYRETWAVPLKDVLASGERPSSTAEGVDVFTRPGRFEPAFLFQTSGTEGSPKWVVCHYWKCAESVECMWQEGALHHARDQTVFLTPPLYHSYGLSALLEYTRAGSTIVLPSGGSPLGPVGDLRDRELAGRITAIEGVPDLYYQLSRIADRLPLAALSHVGFGGGGLDIAVVERLREYYPNVTVSVRYGLTETPSVVAHKMFRPPYDQDWRSSGRIMPIYGVEIAGPSGDRLGPEQEGEIVVTGRCVASYFDGGAGSLQNELRTGDIGYMTRDDELVVVGRRSAFLKYRGFRLSPEQIESVIRSFPGVEDCRALVRDSRLVAEVVSQSALAKGDLLAHVARRLPSHAIPEDIIPVDQIPRTASGKVKRH